MRGRRPTAVAICIAAIVAVILVGLAPVPASAQRGQVLLVSPESGDVFEAGDRMLVIGRVVQVNGTPLGGVGIGLRLLGPQGREVPSLDARVFSSHGDGTFVTALELPANLRAGVYVLRADADSVEIADSQVPITVRVPFQGVPSMITVSFVVAGALAAVGVVVYLRRTGRPRGPFPPPSQGSR